MGLVALGLMGLGSIPGCGKDQEPILENLPKISQIKDFQMMSEDGLEFGQSHLEGRIWVVDFFFTRCPSVCPLLTASMAEIARHWAGENRINFLSVSVDPDYDTPARLTEYARQHALPLNRWTLLTGSRQALRDLCLNSFRLALGESMDENGDITHSTRLVLVDQEGWIRGYFEGLEGEAKERLHRSLEALLGETEAVGADDGSQ